MGLLEAAGHRDLPSTVDPSDIRGLVTTGHRSVRELPLSNIVRTRQAGAHSANEGSPRSVAAVTRCFQEPQPFVYLFISALRGSTRRAVAQRKPSSSRAMAVITLLWCFPRATIFWYRPHSLTCAFQEIFFTDSG